MAEIANVKYYHDAIIDEILVNPSISQGELAKAFGYSQTWVSIIVNSDAFKERLADRKGELIDPKLKASIEERLNGVAKKALDRIIDRLDNTAGMIKDGDLIQMAKLGVGDRNMTKSAPPVQQNLYVVNLPPPARNAVEWAQTVQGGPLASGPIIDVETRNA